MRAVRIDVKVLVPCDSTCIHDDRDCAFFDGSSHCHLFCCDVKRFRKCARCVEALARALKSAPRAGSKEEK